MIRRTEDVKRALAALAAAERVEQIGRRVLQGPRRRRYGSSLPGARTRSARRRKRRWSTVSAWIDRPVKGDQMHPHRCPSPEWVQGGCGPLSGVHRGVRARCSRDRPVPTVVPPVPRRPSRPVLPLLAPLRSLRLAALSSHRHPDHPPAVDLPYSSAGVVFCLLGRRKRGRAMPTRTVNLELLLSRKASEIRTHFHRRRSGLSEMPAGDAQRRGANLGARYQIAPTRRRNSSG
jgi:hypothetical protein